MCSVILSLHIKLTCQTESLQEDINVNSDEKHTSHWKVNLICHQRSQREIVELLGKK